MRLGSQHTINETIKKIEAAAMDVSLSVARTNNFKVQKLQINSFFFLFVILILPQFL